MLMVGLPIGLAGVVLPVFRRHGAVTQPILALTWRSLIAASLAMLAGATALFVAQVIPLELEFSSVEEWIAFVRLSLLGQMWIVRLGLGLIALIALKLAVSPAAWLAGCALAGLAAQATITCTSHSAAIGEGWMPVAADFAHLLAGALWGGGLVALLIAVHQALRDEARRSVETTRALIGRFSPFGIAGVALAAGTGIVLSSVHVADAAALRGSDYGRLILLKTLLAAGAVALAALHKFVTQQHMKSQADVQRFGHTLLAEVLLVVGIFAGAALLASTPPPHHVVTHQMPDGSTHVMVMTDPDFQRALQIAALAILVAGAVAFALEWRARLKS
ncbi:MAG: copper resistance D family protein [Candidatus Brachytrichaceae bacterium NZ_4S206]|jgi:putative copper export protein